MYSDFSNLIRCEFDDALKLITETMESFTKKLWNSDEIIGDELKNIDIKNMKDTYSLQNTDTIDYNVS